MPVSDFQTAKVNELTISRGQSARTDGNSMASVLSKVVICLGQEKTKKTGQKNNNNNNVLDYDLEKEQRSKVKPKGKCKLKLWR